jgi:CheY-like chemotaxis protein
MSSPRDRYVLAVDDDPAYLSVLKLSMRTCGFSKIYAAADGTAALDLLECTRFSLIISDLNMFPMDGLELLRAVKKNPLTSRIPFILMSANLSEEAWREAIGLGATEFLVKPFTLSTLRHACFAAHGTVEYENSAATTSRISSSSNY